MHNQTSNITCDGCGMTLLPHEGLPLHGAPSLHACSKKCLPAVVAKLTPAELPETPFDVIAARVAREAAEKASAARQAAFEAAETAARAAEAEAAKTSESARAAARAAADAAEEADVAAGKPRTVRIHPLAAADPAKGQGQ